MLAIPGFWGNVEFMMFHSSSFFSLGKNQRDESNKDGVQVYFQGTELL